MSLDIAWYCLVLPCFIRFAAAEDLTMEAYVSEMGGHVTLAVYLKNAGTRPITVLTGDCNKTFSVEDLKDPKNGATQHVITDFTFMFVARVGYKGAKIVPSAATLAPVTLKHGETAALYWRDKKDKDEKVLRHLRQVSYFVGKEIGKRFGAWFGILEVKPKFVGHYVL